MPPRLEPDLPFPIDRFIPGEGPRPTSSQLPGEILLIPQNDQWNRCIHHRHAIDLFNHGFYWEAHEEWESLWRMLPKKTPQRWALQALIQSAAALLKEHMGHRRASQTLLNNALRHMEAASSHALVRGTPVLSIDLLELTQNLSRWGDAPGECAPPVIRLSS